MLKFRGSLVAPSILGIAALALGVAATVVPGARNTGSAGLPIWVVGIVAILFSFWILASVVLAYRSRQK